MLGRELLELYRQVTTAPPSKASLRGMQPCPFLQKPIMANVVHIGRVWSMTVWKLRSTTL